MRSQKFTVTYPWDTNGYKPQTEFELSIDQDAFLMYIIVHERNPRRVETEHQRDIYVDSCVEWFVNFSPDICDRYFNFEVNANGAIRVTFRKDRYEGILLTEEDIRALDINTEVSEELWEVRFRVPFSLIRKYIPQYKFEEGMEILANFYKCGDGTEFPHFGIWKPYPLDRPDFHRPEFFGRITIE